MRKCRNLFLLRAACALLAITAGQATALPEDRDKPIHITADKAIRDEKLGVTMYTGNVQMRQGSMELEADTLTIFHDEAQADKMIAKGKPARMRQQPKPEQGLVHAHAEEITYYRDEERVHLQTNAHIEQDGSQVSGNSIDYFIAKELVKAQADPANDGDQVEVVIPPSSARGDTAREDSASTAPAAAAPDAVETDAADAADAATGDRDAGGSGATESE